MEAGQALARKLEHLRDQKPLVLALPRGGVPVAAEIARALDAPLDILLVRKLGAPFQPELAMGAIGEDGIRVLDDTMVRRLRISQRRIDAVEARERQRIEEASESFRTYRPAGIAWQDRTAIVTDDGIATGSTVIAACQVARERQVGHLVVAAPVATQGAVARLEEIADEVVVVSTPAEFMSISQFYEDFAQVTDDEVARLLQTVNQPHEPLEGGDALG
ncbi:MAG TPA: phosphoribosyltransferase family protein [Acidimicrobiia bacterium]|nr:phosphoribosyltransferase family protein [Acidimicrobiia bacterium]